jgi:hypothetical protein
MLLKFLPIYQNVKVVCQDNREIDEFEIFTDLRVPIEYFKRRILKEIEEPFFFEFFVNN